MKFDRTTMKNIDFCTVQLKVHRRRKVLKIGGGGGGEGVKVQNTGGGASGGKLLAGCKLSPRPSISAK